MAGAFGGLRAGVTDKTPRTQWAHVREGKEGWRDGTARKASALHVAILGLVTGTEVLP